MTNCGKPTSLPSAKMVALIYIDRQIIHEVTSPQALEGLRLAGRQPWRTSASVATIDHNVPTTLFKSAADIADDTSRIQVQTLQDNTREFGIRVRMAMYAKACM